MVAGGCGFFSLGRKFLALSVFGCALLPSGPTWRLAAQEETPASVSETTKPTRSDDGVRPIVPPSPESAGTSVSAPEPVAYNDATGGEVAPPPPVGLPGTLPTVAGATRTTVLPRVFAPSRPRNTYTRYPWKLNIVSTVFWIGEKPTPRNPTPNHMSSWDMKWAENFGGYDDPDPDNRTDRYHPVGFIPKLNPFYIALPYNDVQSGTYRTKVEARQIVPWFHREFKRSGHTVLKGRWLAVRRNGKVCYAQWEDVGPFETDDWRYVFGNSRPRTTGNGGAGLDVSPAVRDYLEFNSGHAVCDWRFVDVQEVPDGPWKWYGTNNDFVKMRADGAEETEGLGGE